MAGRKLLLFLSLFSPVLLVLWFGKKLDPASTKNSLGVVTNKVSLYVLGTLQDGGAPHINCERHCCQRLFETPDPTLKVVALGVIDHEEGKSFLFEATPDISAQTAFLKEKNAGNPLDGILITHAHIGHYSGLMYLGKEAGNTSRLPVYLLPKFYDFVLENGPWDQLVKQLQIEPKKINAFQTLKLTSNISVRAFTVPHRDEYSETAGFEIIGPDRTALFIPDIDKWSRWDEDVVQKIRAADLAFLDATFYSGEEIGYRDMTEIPHPSVQESMALFDTLPTAERNKVHFIHMNHTNPLLQPGSGANRMVSEKGYSVAQFGASYGL